MPKHTFWSRIVEDHLSGVFLCGADREGLHDFIYSLAKVSSIDCVDLQFGSQYQPDLFSQPQERWAIVSLPPSKNLSKQIIDMSQHTVDKVLWILVDQIPERLPPSCAGEQVSTLLKLVAKRADWIFMCGCQALGFRSASYSLRSSGLRALMR